MSEMNMSERILQLRREKGWTQEELAQKLNISYQAVSKWENAQACPDIALLPQIADLFEVSIDSLFGREQPEPQVQNLVANLPWKNDNALHLVVYQGHALMGEKQLQSLNSKQELGTVRFEGTPRDVYCTLNLNCESIEGNAQAGSVIKCEGDIGGDAHAGGSVSCGDVGGNAHAGGRVECGDVSGDAQAGGTVNCSDIGGNATAGGSVSCSDVGGDVRANSVSCGDVSGDVTVESGSVNCGDVGGDVQAGGRVECNDVSGDVSASGGAECGDIEGDLHVSGANSRVSCGDVGGDVIVSGPGSTVERADEECDEDGEEADEEESGGKVRWTFSKNFRIFR